MTILQGEAIVPENFMCYGYSAGSKNLTNTKDFWVTAPPPGTSGGTLVLLSTWCLNRLWALDFFGLLPTHSYRSFQCFKRNWVTTGQEGLKNLTLKPSWMMLKFNVDRGETSPFLQDHSGWHPLFSDGGNQNNCMFSAELFHVHGDWQGCVRSTMFAWNEQWANGLVGRECQR